MTLHVFNPSHDEALAANYPYYYPSTIARQLASEWAMLPALWAEDGDWVWLEDEHSYNILKECMGRWSGGVRFVQRKELTPQLWSEVENIDPWGWDLLLRHQLRKAGAPERLLPSDETLADIRRLSGRQTTSHVLPRLREKMEWRGIPTVGESVVATSGEEVEQILSVWGGAMMKTLWSCSGRGVFATGRQPTASDGGRIRRLLREQGGVEMEPIYESVENFALEFFAENDGSVTYKGASLFQTGTSGAYSGNILASQPYILQRLQKKGLAMPGLDLLAEDCSDVLDDFLHGTYRGPLGVDMMLVRMSGSVVLHPCVEVNLRRTMGHVALSVFSRGISLDEMPQHLQRLWLSPQ